MEARRLFVEQAGDITRRHRRRIFARAQSRQLQPRAMVIFGIGIVGLPPCDDSPCTVAQTVADGGESKPWRGESRRKLHRLLQNFGGACKIAPRSTLELRPV